ncbi:endoplasmic reticulum vesicle transporter-domain-containing protein [Multifurca ochricompacta]|uniref:Endoplasmic reticulum vesicle transporter-domain-containing protein n=1 Tax=Multifurca ochricompacta TaxID=376703 RepID=A0AAD4QK98_9AGAM|nr:endoplasmic reticulum vesicle transporter-domain-containing protein [Multifurca ochricompacta]
MNSQEELSLLDKIDAVAPAPLQSFDAFPKLPSTYRTRSSERGFLTLFITFIAFILVANDIGEFLWGWPDYEFGVDHAPDSFLDVNVDLIVNMPCRYLSVDLRDTVGDRLYLSRGFHRDGTLFDIGQATTLREHAEALTARQAVAESRKSRGFLAGLFRRSKDLYKPTYNYEPDGSACRIYGSLAVKRVTGNLSRFINAAAIIHSETRLANLHITTLGHGYSSPVHVDHSLMNLSHVITEFSFGQHFPEITQPLDNSFEVAQEEFVAYQYYLRVVPTTYIAPRSQPLHTNQYSVTHYQRKFNDHSGVPGIFFKFDIEPIRLTIIQRTTTLAQFFIRSMCWVVGGVFVCASWALRATDRVITIVAGPDNSDSIAPTPDSLRGGVLRSKWTGGALRARPSSNASPRAGTWADGGSPYASTYSGSSHGGSAAGSPMLPYSPYSPVAPPPLSGRTPSTAGFPPPGSASPGLGLSPNAFGLPAGSANVHSPATAATLGSPAPNPGTPWYGHFPPTPRSPLSGFAVPPTPRDAGKKAD